MRSFFVVCLPVCLEGRPLRIFVVQVHSGAYFYQFREDIFRTDRLGHLQRDVRTNRPILIIAINIIFVFNVTRFYYYYLWMYIFCQLDDCDVVDFLKQIIILLIYLQCYLINFLK